MNKSKEYAMYLRKSRKDMELEALGEGETLARHREALKELAEKKELKVTKVYEEMVSGESIADRPQMQLLLDDVCAGKFAGVLVMEIERLARGNTKDQGEVAEAFSMSSTLIVTPTKTYDPNNEFDEEYFEFGLFMSRREYKTIRRRMQRGLIEAIKEGNYVGSLPPYGYDIIRLNKKERTLKLNDQSKYVAMMFDWFVNEGLTSGQIAKRLTEMGIPTQTGRSQWNRATVKDIIQNNLYTGMIRWNRRKRTKEMDDGKTIKRKRRAATDGYLIVPGKHPAIVSQEIFDKAQMGFQGKNPAKFGMPLQNPLSRLIFCKHCGKAMIFSKYSNQKPGTNSRFTHAESMTCKVKSSPVYAVMDAVVEALKMHIEDFEFKLTNDEEQRVARQHIETVQAMEEELKKLEKKREQLFEFLESGIYTRDEFMERKSVLTDRIDTARAGLEEYKSRMPAPVDYQEKIVKFTECMDALRDPDVSAQHKNDLIKEIVRRIEYDCIDLGKQKGGKVLLDVYLK